jgi:hypothetical protein
MPGDEGLQLADDVSVPSQREIGVDPQLERSEPKLLETSALVSRERLRELGKGGPAPERQRFAEHLSGSRDLLVRQGLAPFGDELLEPRQIELILAHLEQVARACCSEPRLGQCLRSCET